MSSESEDDDFLSADEGEDQESHSRLHKTTKHSLTKTAKNTKEKAEKGEKFVARDAAVEQQKSSFREASDVSDTCPDQCEEQEPQSRIDKMTKLSPANVAKINTVTEGKDVLEHDKSNPFEKVSDISDTCMEQLTARLQGCEIDDIQGCEIDDISRENSENKEKVIVCKEEISTVDKAEEQLHSGSSKKQNIKEARLGCKKPREKLGERLGAQKIGSRITKPLVGISSDSIIAQNAENVEMKSNEENKSTQEDALNEKVAEISKEDEPSAGWSSWGDWGLSSIASAATTISREVTRGVGTVLETVEGTIGAPNPDELAREMAEEEKMLHLKEESILEEKSEKTVEEKESEQSYSFGFGTLGSLVSGVSNVLESASNKVLLGGLDTLEKIGRKTMDIIQEGDPGLRRKKAFLTSKKPDLSLVLLEARKRAIAEEELRKSYEGSDKKTQVSMVRIWDDTEGSAHLEALSIISKECQVKLVSFLNELATAYHSDYQERMAEIKNCANISEDDKTENIHSNLLIITRDCQLALQFRNVITGWPSLEQSLSKLSIQICGLGNTDFTEIQHDLYKEVAVYVSEVVGIFQKAAIFSLTTPNLKCLLLAQQFQRLCSCISGGLEKFADDVCESITRAFPASDPEFNGTITNIYLQMAEVNSYLETALLELNAVLVYVCIKETYHFRS